MPKYIVPVSMFHAEMARQQGKLVIRCTKNKEELYWEQRAKELDESADSVLSSWRDLLEDTIKKGYWQHPFASEFTYKVLIKLDDEESSENA